MQYGAESLFSTDDHYVFTNKGAATIKIDQKAKTATINIKKGVKWSDGKQVTAKTTNTLTKLLLTRILSHNVTLQV